MAVPQPYQRIIGGIGVAAIYFVFLRARGIHTDNVNTSIAKSIAVGGHQYTRRTRLGVSCYQWALSTTPSGIVLPIVATLPLAVIPFAYRFEGDRPGWHSVIGGIIAVAGVIALTLARLKICYVLQVIGRASLPASRASYRFVNGFDFYRDRIVGVACEAESDETRRVFADGAIPSASGPVARPVGWDCRRYNSGSVKIRPSLPRRSGL